MDRPKKKRLVFPSQKTIVAELRRIQKAEGIPAAAERCRELMAEVRDLLVDFGSEPHPREHLRRMFAWLEGDILPRLDPEVRAAKKASMNRAKRTRKVQGAKARKDANKGRKTQQPTA